MLISVILPVYNAENFLEKTIESVLSQSYTNFELIIINDGSTDDSLSICHKYENYDNRIRVFSQLNSGPGKARNMGIKNSSGDYITFIDSDDLVSQTWLENYVKILSLKEYDLIEINYITTDDKFYNKRYSNLKEKRIVSNTDIVENFLIGKNTSNFIWNKIFKNKKILFRDLNYGEDFVYILENLLVAHSYFNSESAEYFHIENPKSLTRINFNPKKLDSLKAFDISSFELKNKCLDHFQIYLIIRKLFTLTNLLNQVIDNQVLKNQLLLDYKTHYKSNFFKINTSKISMKQKALLLKNYLLEDFNGNN